MAYFKAYQQVKDGKTHVWYYRGKSLWYQIIQYDDGWFHALTSKDAGPLVPTLEAAKRSIEEHIRLIDSLAGSKKTRITYDYGVYGVTK
ncbi:MAG: hypothetical protein IJ243_03475 [Prevotella sp.]|nr:hypothetical protein [Prevotella sp.]